MVLVNARGVELVPKWYCVGVIGAEMVLCWCYWCRNGIVLVLLVPKWYCVGVIGDENCRVDYDCVM